MKLKDLIDKGKQPGFVYYSGDTKYIVGAILISLQQKKQIKLICKPLSETDSAGFTWNGLIENLEELIPEYGEVPVLIHTENKEVPLTKIEHIPNVPLTIME